MSEAGGGPNTVPARADLTFDHRILPGQEPGTRSSGWLSGSLTIVFGPGSAEQVHTVDEFVRLTDVVEAATMLVEAVRRTASYSVSRLDLDAKHCSHHLKGAAMACKHAIPRMVARGGGVIANNASIQAIAGVLCADAYTAAKGSLVSLTRALAVEWAPRNVRTNCICPGPIDTPMISVLLEGASRSAMTEAVPPGRVGTAAEVARVAVFLASDDASYVNGVILPVDNRVVVDEPGMST